MADNGVYRFIGRWRNIRNTLRLGLVVCTGVALAAGAFVLLRLTETQKMQAEFEDEATERAGAVRRSIESKLIVLQSLRACLQSHYPEANQEHFAAFSRPLLARAHGVQALEWIPRVAHGERAAFEADAKRRWPSHSLADRRRGPRISDRMAGPSASPSVGLVQESGAGQRCRMREEQDE